MKTLWYRIKVYGFGLSLAAVGLAPSSWAWQEQGHHAICAAATRLVQEPALQAFLLGKPHVMGHLCDIPDIYWRGLRKFDEATDHWVNPDTFQYDLEKTPQTFHELVEQLKKQSKVPLKKKNPAWDASERFGSLFWRADQFYRLAIVEGKRIAGTVPPKDRKQMQDSDLPFNQAVYGMLVDMGLMGHYVGDASMPYHGTHNADGWDNGHGGIHSYYEGRSVDAMELNLEQTVLEAAAKEPVLTGSVVDRVRKIAQASALELPKVEAADHMLEPSHGSKENGKPAKRPPASDGAKEFSALIIPELARSAKLLAALWDEIYRKSGSPDLSAYHSYRYPLEPPYVERDYIK